MNKQWWIIGALVVVVALVAFVMVGRKPAETTAETPAGTPAQEQPVTAVPTAPADTQGAFLTENLKKDGWKATESGLQYHVLTPATDAAAVKPAAGSEVTVNYEGKLIDGTVFDSSYARNEPATFPLSNVIRGWQEGVPMMKVGETWEFAIPPGLGYGDRNVGPIPASSVLVFKIELLKAPTAAQ
jgi:FKBP-type peptidyl-prolyl cis-trans isomerase FkpA